MALPHPQHHALEPVLRDFHNIEHRDAVLAYDQTQIRTGPDGKPVMRWDGRTMKQHPSTGRDVPDEAAQVAVWDFINPRKAPWPEADYIVGNPPFIGAGTMRAALGDGYVEALRKTWKDVPESADFVMYWWQHAAEAARHGKLKRFGLITTNSLRQTFNRRVIEAQMAGKPPLALAFAIPDHPWVDSADGAAVRIAMTVGCAANGEFGRVQTVQAELDTGADARMVTLSETVGRINADLTIGADVSQAVALRANGGISSPGVKLHGSGFIVTPEEAKTLGLGTVPGLETHIREYRNGRDLTDSPRGVMVIDLFGLTEEQARSRFPLVYQLLLERVKPERDAKADSKDGAGYARHWWLHGKPRTEMRPALAGLPRYIATVETAKHRTFQFLPAKILPDNMLIAIAMDNAYALGILSSQVHITWALAAGGRLGIGNDPRYNKSKCFETFPFPQSGSAHAVKIASLAEEIDALRKRQQATYPVLTLTGMYNVLEKLRAGEALSDKDKTINEMGLVATLKNLHDQLDAAALEAYGWQDLAPAFRHGPIDEATRQTLLSRLAALNAERAREEAAGQVRWLRPDYQAPGEAAKTTTQGQQATLVIEPEAPGKLPATEKDRRPWPAELAAQMRAVADVLAASGQAMTEGDIAAHFTARGPWKRRLPQIIETLVALGRARIADSRIIGI